MARSEYPGPKGRRPLDGHTHVWRVGDHAQGAAHSVASGVGCAVIEIGYGAVKVRWDDDSSVMVVHPSDIRVPVV